MCLALTNGNTMKIEYSKMVKRPSENLPQRRVPRQARDVLGARESDFFFAFFAVNIPFRIFFGCGCAALGPLWLILRFLNSLVAALPPFALFVVNISSQETQKNEM